MYTLAAVLVDLASPFRLNPLSPALVVAFPMIVFWIKWAHPSPEDLSTCWNAQYFVAKRDLTVDYEMTWWSKLGSALVFIGLMLYGARIILH